MSDVSCRDLLNAGEGRFGFQTGPGRKQLREVVRIQSSPDLGVRQNGLDFGCEDDPPA